MMLGKWRRTMSFYKRKKKGQVDSGSLCHNNGQWTSTSGTNTIKHVFVVQVEIQGLYSKVLAS